MTDGGGGIAGRRMIASGVRHQQCRGSPAAGRSSTTCRIRAESLPLTSAVERADGFQDRAAGGPNVSFPRAAMIICRSASSSKRRSSSISSQARQAVCRPGARADRRCRHVAWCRRSGGLAEGWGCGRGPSAFFEGGTNAAGAARSQPSSIPAARSRELTDRTAWRQRPGPRGRTGTPSGSRMRQAHGKDAQQMEAAAGCSVYAAERCLGKIPRYSSLREFAPARRHALAARRTRSDAYNRPAMFLKNFAMCPLPHSISFAFPTAHAGSCRVGRRPVPSSPVPSGFAL